MEKIRVVTQFCIAFCLHFTLHPSLFTLPCYHRAPRMRSKLLLPLWCLVAAIAISINLGGHPLLDADEGRNGEVGREMAATNDYVMPRLDALPYVDKPIVYFPAEAVALEVLGPTAAAARLPPPPFPPPPPPPR